MQKQQKILYDSNKKLFEKQNNISNKNMERDMKILQIMNCKIQLAAPTGRAAKRMAEITKEEAKTIHSLLGVTFPRGFKHHRENPLDLDILIVDESSMIDTSLMNHLLKALPDHARLLLVGDTNQLPSVGPGNVLKDLIDTQQIPTVELKEIFRQAAGSKIIQSAHRINQGIMPELYQEKDSDFYFVEKTEPQEILQTILSLVSGRLSKHFAFDPLKDVQVLSPMKKGPLGIERLNLELQKTLNPQQLGILVASQRFSKGDKVMQIRNNYDKDVFNGDVGKIIEIDLSEKSLLVNFDGVHTHYEFSELDELVLAYAVSVHKYQGSECPCIIVPVHTVHFKMLHRNLLYTAVTRGKKLVIVIGSKKALSIAVRNDEVKTRYSGLKSSLLAKCCKKALYL